MVIVITLFFHYMKTISSAV